MSPLRFQMEAVCAECGRTASITMQMDDGKMPGSHPKWGPPEAVAGWGLLDADRKYRDILCPEHKETTP